MIHWQRATGAMGAWRPWLTNHGSLTQVLRDAFPDFNVRRLRQAVAPVNHDEAASLGLRRGQRAMIREVLLQSAATPLVYAHTVIPLTALRGSWNTLATLGNRSLGGTLFADPRVARFPLEFKRLDRRHPLFRAAAGHLDIPAGSLWARRSQFALDGHALMVTEVFLPAMLRPETHLPCHRATPSNATLDLPNVPTAP